MTDENILLEASQTDTKTITEITSASDGQVTITHTRYQTLRQVTVKLKNNLIMTCDSAKPIFTKLFCDKQCPKEDVLKVITQLEKETQLQADDIHYGAY